MVLPCGIGGRDARLALADMVQTPDAWLMINRWPTLPEHPRRAKIEAPAAADRYRARQSNKVEFRQKGGQT